MWSVIDTLRYQIRREIGGRYVILTPAPFDFLCPFRAQPPSPPPPTLTPPPVLAPAQTGYVQSTAMIAL